MNLRHSPVIDMRKTEDINEMTFPEAMASIIKGNKITRKSWGSKEEYGLLKDGKLMIHTKGNFHIWSVNDGDMQGMDWYEI